MGLCALNGVDCWHCQCKKFQSSRNTIGRTWALSIFSLDGASMIEIVLPWPPSSLSPNTRQHWSKLAKSKKLYRYECWAQAKAQGVQKSDTGSLHLDIVFVPPSRRAFDLDNCLARIKAGLDGLADALGVDDKHWSLSIAKSPEIGGMVKIKIARRMD